MNACCEKYDAKFCPECGKRIPPKSVLEEVQRYLESQLRREETKLSKAESRKLKSERNGDQTLATYVTTHDIPRWTANVETLRKYVQFLKTIESPNKNEAA